MGKLHFGRWVITAGILISTTATYAVTELDEIIVTATRQDQSLAEVSSAVSVVEKDAIQAGRQQLGLDESLNRVPGIFFQNRYNFSQDLRVAIRGFGARANFGIRGIKVFVDDLPATLADGQSGVDDIDIGSVGRIEIIRGPSSALYGSSSGGVMSLHTEDGPDTPFAEARVTVGEYDHQKYQLKFGGQTGKLNYLVNGSYMESDGYRANSRVEHGLVNSKYRYEFDDDSDLTMIFNLVESPQADDSGGIRETDVAADRRQAQPRNLSSNAGEELEQQKFGWIYRHQLGENHEIRVRNYYLWRDFQAFLPIGSHIRFVPDDGVVEFDRFFFGGGAQYTFTGELFGRSNQFTTGFDIDIQEDDRQRYSNDAGIKGALSFDQLEDAQAYGFYVRNSFALTDSLQLTLGGRYDIVDLSVDDRFLANADQTGDLDFGEFSPSAGLTWSAMDSVSFYFNYATAFETPTFTELANPARNLDVSLGGFASVDAQNAESFEIGARGLFGDRVYFDIAGFIMDVEDEVVSVTNIGNRTFFENADTDRNGIEAAIVVDIMEGLQLTASYTYSDFEFARFPTNMAAEGKMLPGIPENQFFAELAYRHDSGFYLSWDILLVNDLAINNTNSAISDSYEVANLRAGHRLQLAGFELSPFIGINNLFDTKYMSNLRLNGFGGRVFEPAPTLNVYGGVSVRLNY